MALERDTYLLPEDSVLPLSLGMPFPLQPSINVRMGNASEG